jgi:flagellar FliL protein
LIGKKSRCFKVRHLNSKTAAFLFSQSPKSLKISLILADKLVEVIRLSEPKKEEQQPKKDKSGLIMGILFAVVNLGVSGTGLFFAYKGTIGWNPPVYTEEQAFEKLKSEQSEMEKLPMIYTMEPFKSNLDDTPVRAVEIEVSFEMMNHEGYEELIDSDNQAKARDQILQILQNKSYDDIASVQGKLFLKEQFADAINAILKKGIVKDIFFSKFRIE